MKMKMKFLVLLLAKLFGLFHVASWLTRNRLRILGYHGIWFSEDHFGNFLFMSAEKFQSRMSWLQKSKYQVISLNQAMEEFEQGKIRPYTTVVTIDDGWYGTYVYMLPILEQDSLPATLYVYTEAVESQKALINILMPALVRLSRVPKLEFDFLVGDSSCLDLQDKELVIEKLASYIEQLNAEQRESFCEVLASKLGFDFEKILQSRQFGLMSFEEIADANRRGLDIQLHTHTHTCDIEKPEKLVSEIQINRKKLLPFVTSSLKHFCYPSGICTPHMYPYLAESQVYSATLTQIGLVEKGSDPYALKRILDGQDVSQLEFEGELSGFFELFRKLKSKLP